MIWIGVTCDFETIVDSRGAPAPRYILGEAYTTSILNAGAFPLMLPHGDLKLVPEILDKIDGLVISGGDFDVPPSYYGAAPKPGLGKLQPQRSDVERALIEGCLKKGTPLLGICGGMQLLNVVCGGTLHQDQAHRPDSLEHQQQNDKRETSHEVNVVPHSRLHQLTGATRLEVNSTHHQLLDAVGDTLEATGVAPDGVVEAIEWRGESFALGVQWHPESLPMEAHQNIYRGFVAAC